MSDWQLNSTARDFKHPSIHSLCNTPDFYFRVKQVYPGGYSRYSNIKQVNLENSDFPGFTIYPNPANTQITVSLPSQFNTSYSVKVFDVYGKRVKDMKFNGSESVLIDVRDLANGLYLVVVENALRKRMTKKIIVE